MCRVPEDVCLDPAAVDPLPLEEVVGEGVGLVPGQLGRQEAGDPGTARELRQGTGEAEGIRQPGDRAAPAEALLEVPLAVQELPHESLSTHHLAVRLDPAPADRLPAPLGESLAHAFEQRRVVLLDPGRELCRGLYEGEVQVAIHQPEHGGKGAPAFAACLGDRPEPGEVEVRVPGQR